MSERLILASRSKSRRALLAGAGVSFDCLAADLDEMTLKIKGRTEGWPVSKTALRLAEAKADMISKVHPEAYVIGADQMLECEGRLFDKPETLAQARDHLRFLRGRTHQLVSAVCVVKNANLEWSQVLTADLTLRDFSDAFLEAYLEKTSDHITETVGGYRLESLGVQLFEKIEGDYFTILGLPLLPLLGFLRTISSSEILHSEDE